MAVFHGFLCNRCVIMVWYLDFRPWHWLNCRQKKISETHLKQKKSLLPHFVSAERSRYFGNKYYFSSIFFIILNFFKIFKFEKNSRHSNCDALGCSCRPGLEEIRIMIVMGRFRKSTWVWPGNPFHFLHANTF